MTGAGSIDLAPVRKFPGNLLTGARKKVKKKSKKVNLSRLVPLEAAVAADFRGVWGAIGGRDSKEL